MRITPFLSLLLLAIAGCGESPARTQPQAAAPPATDKAETAKADNAKPDEWHTLSLRWDLSSSQCESLLDEKRIETLPLHARTLNGVSYLRIRSAAASPDPHGIIVRRVQAQISDPNAPAVTPEQVAASQQEYVKTIVPQWLEKKADQSR